MQPGSSAVLSPRRPIPWCAVALAVLLLWWTVRLSWSESPWCFVDFANLAFHEAGHLFFHPLGSTMGYLGGTLGQCLVPVLVGVWFFVRERRPLGCIVCVWWLGENLINVARYMADARELALPLVGGGDHDWNELFYRFGLLGEESVATVAGITRGFGVTLMVLGLAGIGILIGTRVRGSSGRIASPAGAVRPAPSPRARTSPAASGTGRSTRRT